MFKDIDQKLAADLRINWNSCTLILSKCYFSLQYEDVYKRQLSVSSTVQSPTFTPPSLNALMSESEILSQFASLSLIHILLYRAMDRSRRAIDPQNYNDDGTVKKGRKKMCIRDRI